MGKIFAISVIAGLIGLTTPLVQAAEEKVPPINEKQKNLCILYSQNCPIEPVTIQEKMKQLQEEIERGTSVYTPPELRILEQKLKDAQGVYDFLNN